MAERFTQTLREWHNFYILSGTAAATLIGLLFVAVSLGAPFFTEQTMVQVRTFVTPTLIHFGAVLVLALLMMIPTQTRLTLTLELSGLSLSGLGYTATTMWRMWFYHQQEVLKPDHWLWHGLAPATSYLSLGLVALALRGDGLALLNVIAFAMLLLVVMGVHNAWILILYIAQQHRAQR